MKRRDPDRYESSPQQLSWSLELRPKTRMRANAIAIGIE